MEPTKVRLQLPADPIWTHLARSVVAAAADPSRFDLDRLDDLSLAVGEAITSLIDLDGADHLDLETRWEGDGVRVEVSVGGEQMAEATEGIPGGLLAYLLASVATDVTSLSGTHSAGVGFTVGPR